MISLPAIGVVRHGGYPMGVMVLSERDRIIRGTIEYVDIRDNILWAHGWADHYLTKLLEELDSLPCGVDLDAVREEAGIHREWRLRGLTLYHGEGSPAFGGSTFIRLRDST